MSRWLKLDMDVASAVTLADAQCMEAAKMSRAEREHLVSVVSAPSMFVMPKISGTHCR
ncbi:BnaC04g15450D [Brassica napus]|uniref:BnaC04g15450D protein n=2 Tax=Brassica napus TaxID=3708 RepID=A0A078FS97_BRANA|nr:BnaC04g15450D [Brassica napus]